MNSKWPQQTVFSQRVRDYCKKNGLTTPRGAVKLDVVSDLFGISEETLRQFLQHSGRKRPHVDTLTHIATVLGCSVTDFLDAPSDPPPGMPLERWAGLTEHERTLISSLLADIASDDLSAAEKEWLYKVYFEAKKMLLELKKT